MSKFKVNEGTFIGDLGRHNGATVTAEFEKDDKGQTTEIPMIGKSGETSAYKTTDGGRLYLEDSQVTAV